MSGCGAGSTAGHDCVADATVECHVDGGGDACMDAHDAAESDSVIPSDTSTDELTEGPQIEVSPAGVDFGWVRSGLTATSSVDIVNISGHAIVVTAQKLGGWDQGLSVSPLGESTLDVGGQLSLEFSWKATGEDSAIRDLGAIQISADRTQLAPLAVTGGADIPWMESIPAEVRFQFDSIQDEFLATLTIRNSGQVPFVISDAWLDCSGYLGTDCRMNTCPVSAEFPQNSGSYLPHTLGPAQFIPVIISLQIAPGAGCTNGTVLMNIATDITPEAYVIPIDIN